MKPYKINSDCSLTIEDIKAMAKILDAETYKGFGQPEETELARIARVLDGKKSVTDLMCLKLFQEFFDVIPRNSADYRWARQVLNLTLKELNACKGSYSGDSND